MIEEWKIYKDNRRNGRKGSGGSNGCLWEVSNLGRVKKNGEIIKLASFKGYPTCRCGFVHRMVAICFIPNPDNKPQVDHIDTDRTNNVVTNLKWVTQSENQRNPITYQKMKEYKPTDETKQKMKGRVVTEEQRKRHSVFMKEYWKTHDTWNKGKKMSEDFCTKNSEIHKGQIPWNKGLTKETDVRLLIAGQKEKNTKRTNKYIY